MDKPMNNTGRRDEPELVSAKKVALGLPKQAWRTVTWREGSDRPAILALRACACPASVQQTDPREAVA